MQGLGAHHLVNTPLPPGVHVLPKAVDDSIAAALLAAKDIRLDAPRPEQEDDFKDWINGIGSS